MIKRFFDSYITRMVIALVLVGIVSGVTLVLVYNYAQPRIKVNQNREAERAVKSIFPEMHEATRVIGQEGSADSVVKVSDADGRLLGYAFTAEGNGYQGTVRLIVGIDPDLSKLQGFEVVESQETPGLGAEIAEKPFQQQFIGLDAAHPIEYLKNQKPVEPYQIEAITGATISSRAVVNMLNKRLVELREQLKDKR
jgi:electron transport complex protein RnfG